MHACAVHIVHSIRAFLNKQPCTGAAAPAFQLLQATSRIWRYGQSHPCFVYHLLYAGTLEQQQYTCALAKQELFERVSAAEAPACSALHCAALGLSAVC